MNPSDKYEQIKDIKHLNPVELEAMVLHHAQQIKDIAKHLLELQRYMKFKRREWVGLTGAEINHIFAENVGYPRRMMKEVDAKLREKNGG